MFILIDVAYHSERHDTTRGAPRYQITHSQLCFFMKCGFTIVDMGKMLGVSISTVKRRMR